MTMIIDEAASVVPPVPPPPPPPSPPPPPAEANGRDKSTRWNKTAKALFLTHLAALCSVCGAAAAIGLAVSGAYAQRQKDPEFREQWDVALEAGYARLEHELLDRAVNGQAREVMNRQGQVVTLKAVSNRLGLALLRLHFARVAAIRALHGDDDDEAIALRVHMHEKIEQLANNRANAIAAQGSG